MAPDAAIGRTAARLPLILAGAAVLLAAADTYVVVLALPDVMVGVGLDSDDLGRAAPIISVFLLGYVAVLPLVGRLADLTGRLPVLVACLLLFAAGSLVTATADTLTGAVVGRGIQGVGAGGLVPATLALVADLYPVDRRGPPLGAIGAAQETGALLGPLYGALLLALADWRLIFWANLGAGLVLAVALLATSPRRARPDPVGLGLAGLCTAAVTLLLVAPEALVNHLTWGELYLPVAGDHRALSPLALSAMALGGLVMARAALVPRGLVGVPPVRGAGRVVRNADLPGSLLLAVVLGALVLTFSVADPQREAVADSWPLWSVVALFAGVLFVWRERRSRAPVVPLRVVRPRASYGGLLVSLLIGAALIAALVDVPVFARVSGRDQLDAALLLVRLLVAVPIGAALGGFAVRRIGAPAVTAAGAVLAAAGLAAMVRWDEGAPATVSASAALVVAGLGFGLTVAPINGAVLAATDRSMHGLASALVVVARMVGMLVGLSALTAIGLSRFNEMAGRITSPAVLCPGSPIDCPAYDAALREAAFSQLHTVFAAGAVCALVAAVVAVLTLGARPATQAR